jgi:hypothetical protein
MQLSIEFWSFHCFENLHQSHQDGQGQHCLT